MALQYALYKNHLTTVEDGHSAVPQNVKSYKLEDLLKEMVVPGGVTATQAAAVLESFMGTQKKVLQQGCSINTEYYNIYPRISGVFEGDEDRFDPARHRISLSARLGTHFAPVPEEIQVEKVLPTERVPIVRKYIDSLSGIENQMITPGKAGEIRGLNLKLDTEDENQGVFFTSSEKRYRCSVYMRNSSRTLMFILPDTMDAGDYRVTVKALVPRTKEIREGRLKVSVRAS